MNRSSKKFRHYIYKLGLLGLTGFFLVVGCAPRDTIKPDTEKDVIAQNIIHDIDVEENDKGTSLVIRASQTLPYVALTNPLGIDLIFENTSFESFKEEIPIESDLIHSIKCDRREEARSARVRIELKVAAQHEVHREGNDLVVRYTRPKIVNSKKRAAESIMTSERQAINTEDVRDVAPPAEKVAWVNRVDFETQKGGRSRVIVETSKKVPHEIKPLDKKVILVLRNTRMLQYQERPLITTRFKSAVDRISPMRTRDKKDLVLITVELREMVPYRIEQDENTYVLHFDPSTIPPRPLAAAQLPEWEKVLQKNITALVEKKPGAEKEVLPKERPVVTKSGKTYTGQKISLEFQDADIHNVFRILAEVSEQNFVIGDDVKGRVTLKLDNVPSDQVMDLVLQMHKLGKVVEGNVIRIATLQTLQKEKDALAAKIASESKAEPLRTRYIPINYARAEEIKKRLDDIKSNRGTVTLDERTNMIIMHDIPNALKEAEEVVRQLDIATPQVLIEARIVEVSSSFVREIGIQWGGSVAHQSGSLGGTIGAAGEAGNNFLVNLPPGGGVTSGLGFSFARLIGTTTSTLSAKLLAMETQGKGKIISTPKVATLDNVKATIQQGDKVPYPQQTEDGISVAYAEATLKLEVTPNISPDEKVGLLINIKKQQADWEHTVQGAPTITTKEAETEVLVASGETLAIGGIIIDDKASSQHEVPWLAKIPVLGWLFRSKYTRDATTELLIFITPKILKVKEGHTAGSYEIVS